MMSATHADQLVRDYLSRLGSALQGVPAARREEILEEISNHIADERGQLHDDSDAAVLNLLDRIGDPAEVAEAARDETDERPAAQPRRIGPVEVLALVLTPLIWPAGIILLWLSPAWKVRDKLIGTLAPPGGYGLAVFALPLLLFQGMSVCTSGGDTPETCTGLMAQPMWVQIVVDVALVGGLLLLLVLPILTAIYLAYRARKWSAGPQA
jgi:uncharacterized membrane protein